MDLVKCRHWPEIRGSEYAALRVASEEQGCPHLPLVQLSTFHLTMLAAKFHVESCLLPPWVVFCWRDTDLEL